MTDYFSLLGQESNCISYGAICSTEKLNLSVAICLFHNVPFFFSRDSVIVVSAKILVIVTYYFAYETAIPYRYAVRSLLIIYPAPLLYRR